MRHKKFNAVDRGQGFQSKDQKKGDGRNPLQCWTCGNDHSRTDCPQHQGSRPQIYSAQEAQTIGHVGLSIPLIYAALGNRQADNQASIIEIEGNLCDQVVSILSDPRSNYCYINPDLVDKCCLNKQVHVEYWLLQLATGTKKIVHHWVR